jgi:1-deoxy-D-xylulose-5-phosphate reductoisomerase
MRLPIQYSLVYPERLPNRTLPRYDPLDSPSLTFEPLDSERYPCFPMAVEAGRRGGTYPAVLSAANEEAVHLFLDGRIRFGDIHTLVSGVLDRHEADGGGSLKAILRADDWARRHVGEAVGA